MNKEFNGTVALRLAICYAAMNLRPNAMDFLISLLNAGPALVVCEQAPIDRDRRCCEQNWMLYKFQPSDPCPITRVQMAPWLVDGIGAIQGGSFPYETIDPAGIIANLRDVVSSSVILEHVNDDFMQVIDDIERAAAEFKAKHPDVEEAMRHAIRIKGMAVEEHIATGSHQEASHYERQLLA